MGRFIPALAVRGCASLSAAAEPSPAVGITWESVVRASNTTPSLQVAVNPPLRRGSKAQRLNGWGSCPSRSLTLRTPTSRCGTTRKALNCAIPAGKNWPAIVRAWSVGTRPVKDEGPEVQQFTFWDQAAGFLNTVRHVESIRKRLSPKTATMINEVGAISADGREQNQPGHVTKPIPRYRDHSSPSRRRDHPVRRSNHRFSAAGVREAGRRSSEARGYSVAVVELEENR